MSIRRFLSRANLLFNLAKIILSHSSESILHLCQLLTSVYFSGLPTITLRDLINQLQCSPGVQINRVTVHPFLIGTGSGSVSEMTALSVLVAVKRPKSVLEFGTHEGYSTWHLWANTSNTTRVVTIDLPTDVKVSGSSDFPLQGVSSRPLLPDDPRIELIEIDSRLWKPNSSLRFDFCFIDAGHTYDCVKNDTEKTLSIMNENGLVLWHDSTWRKDRYGVNKYLKEMRSAGYDVRLIVIGPYDYCGLAVLLI